MVGGRVAEYQSVSVSVTAITGCSKLCHSDTLPLCHSATLPPMQRFSRPFYLTEEVRP
jgi:hypothetical protein